MGFGSIGSGTRNLVNLWVSEPRSDWQRTARTSRSWTSTKVQRMSTAFVSCLAGPDSDYMTGQAPLIDGGLVYR